MTAPAMSVDEAVVLLHNLAHTFMAPTILSEAVTVAVKAMQRYETLTNDTAVLQAAHTTLLQEHNSLIATHTTLQQHVQELLRQQEVIQSYINTAAKGILAQVQPQGV